MDARNLERYERLVNNMDMPNHRKKATAENARWFLRHGGICNLQHKNFYDVLQIAQLLC